MKPTPCPLHRDNQLQQEALLVPGPWCVVRDQPVRSTQTQRSPGDKDSCVTHVLKLLDTFMDKTCVAGEAAPPQPRGRGNKWYKTSVQGWGGLLSESQPSAPAGRTG